MLNNEKVTLEIDADIDSAQSRFNVLNGELREINKELRKMRDSGEVGSEGWKAMKLAQKGVKDELREIKKNVDVNTASYKELNSALRFWEDKAKSATRGTKDWTDAMAKVEEIKPVFNELKREMNELGGQVQKQPGLWNSMKGQILAVFTGVGLVNLVQSAGRALVDFGKDIFNVTAKFQKYEVVLENATGSHEKAMKAMSEIKKLAASTPFSVEELTESYVKFVNRGITPTMAEMTRFGDIAASQGKSFDQLTEAVLDAYTGEFERLKEFGIRAKSSGDQVTLSFKGVNQTVAKTPEAIQGALLGFGELDGVMGGMAAISGTLEGKMSNLGDTFDQIKLALGDILMPIFQGFLNLILKGSNLILELLEPTSTLMKYYDILADVFKQAWDIGKQLFLSLLPKGAENTISLSNVFKIMASVMGTALLGIKALLSAFQVLIDTFIVAGNAGKTFFYLITGQFEKASQSADKTSESWDSLKTNAKKNFGDIQKNLASLWSNTTKATDVATDSVVKHKQTVEDTEKEITDTKKTESDKRLKNEKEAKQERERINLGEVTEIKKLEVEKLEAYKSTGRDLNADWKKVQEGMTENAKKEARKQGKVFWDSVTSFKELWKQAKEDLKKNMNDATYWVQSAFNLAYMVISKWQEKLQSDFASTSNEIGKTLIKHKMAMADAANSTVQAVDSLLAGNLLGAVTNGAKALMTAMDSWISKSNDLFLARLEERKKELEAAGEIFITNSERFVSAIDLDSIKQVYGDFISSLDVLEGIRMDLGEYDTSERQLQQEIQIGQHIVKNYETAVEKEEAYSDLRLSNIEKAYNAEIKRINDRYALLDALASQQYSADIQAILENQSRELEALISNEESKTSIAEEYARKRSEINRIFALADMQITEGMDQAQIDAINSARQARDAALVDLQKWYNTELEYVVNSEDQKRKEYSETERIQLETQEKLNNLALKQQADDIQRNLEKNQEILAAEEKLNADLENESKRHNDELVRLGQEKDTALAESFNILKNIVTNGYDEIMARAQEAYTQGMITAAQYNDLINQLNTIRSLTNSSFTLPNFNWDLNFNNWTGAKGGIVPGPSHSDGGVDLFERKTGAHLGNVEGGEPLMVLSRNTYKNNKAVVDMLLNSSLHQNGAPIRLATGGMVPYSQAQRSFQMAENTSATSIHKSVELNMDSTAAALQALKGSMDEQNRLLNSMLGSLEEIAAKDNSAASLLHNLDRMRENIKRANAA